jgi:hypothetical protein
MAALHKNIIKVAELYAQNQATLDELVRVVSNHCFTKELINDSLVRALNYSKAYKELFDEFINKVNALKA